MIKNIADITILLEKLREVVEEELASNNWNKEIIEELLRLRKLINDTSNIYDVEYMHDNLMSIYYNLVCLYNLKQEEIAFEMRAEYDEDLFKRCFKE